VNFDIFTLKLYNIYFHLKKKKKKKKKKKIETCYIEKTGRNSFTVMMNSDFPGRK
jgi:hypothetical protein